MALTVVDIVAFESRPVAAATVTYSGAAGAPRVGMIGDSVMAAVRWGGTWSPLRRFNYTYDAESCRRTIGQSCRGREGFAPDNTVQAMQRLRGQLGDIVFIGTGYDDSGSTFSSAVDAVMAEAAAQGIRTVVWLTMRTADVTYVGPTYSSNRSTFRDNNRILLAKETQYGGRLRIADWATYSANRSDWVLADGVHLSGAGAWAFAQYIVDQAAAHFDEISRPSTPLNVTATPISSGQIRLSWTVPSFPGFTPIGDYGFQRSSDGGRTWRGGHAGGSTARDAVISGLTNGLTYHFRVAARNGAGWGELSDIVTVVPRVMPPSAPRVSATVVGSGQVQLNWSAPSAPGGAPILYYGFQRSSDGGRTWRGGYAGPPTARSVVISGLADGQSQQFRVAAINSAGWGAISPVVAATPRPMPPSAPTLAVRAVGPNQVQLSWTTPAHTGGPAIQYYGYQWSSDGGRTWRGGYAGSATERSAIIGGLTAGQTYRFKLAGRNSVGWGTISNIVAAVPAVTRPSAPSLSASSAGTGQVRLSWTAPAHTGGAPIVDYGYQWSSDGGVTWRGGYAGTATDRTVVVDGLTPGEQYHFRLAARNSAGWGVTTPAVPAVSGSAAHTAALEPEEPTPQLSVTAESTPGDPVAQETAPEARTTVGDLVWADIDGDGRQGADEPGVGNVMIRLVDSEGAIVGSAVTDERGAYQLLVDDGEFWIEVVIPTGYDVTIGDAGGDDAVDSDASPADVRSDSLETTVRIRIEGFDDQLDVGLVRRTEAPVESTPPEPSFDEPTASVPGEESPPPELSSPTTTVSTSSSTTTSVAATTAASSIAVATTTVAPASTPPPISVDGT